MPCTHWLLLWRPARAWPARTAPLDGANSDQSRGRAINTPLFCHQTEPCSSHKQSHFFTLKTRELILLSFGVFFFILLSSGLFIYIFLSFVICLSLSSSSSAIMCKRETILTSCKIRMFYERSVSCCMQFKYFICL
jgi:hypothetical protein